MVIALVPIAVAVVRGIRRGWLPVGDNGLIYVRTTDVFTANPPLLCTWSFGSRSAEVDFNHPGPLMYDLLAIPTRLFGPEGLAVGAALINAIALIGIFVVGRRLGGSLIATAAVTMTALLCWTMGSELLYDPWWPNSLLLPFLLFLMVAWALSSGQFVMLPWLIFLGSLLLEANLGFGLVVPGVALTTVWALTLTLRRHHQADPQGWPALRQRIRRTVLIAAAVALICWIQPLIEQFTSDGQGNLTRIAQGLTSVNATVGFREAVRLFAGVTAVWWLRDSMAAIHGRLPSLEVALISLAVLTALLTSCALLARRRRDGLAATAIVVAATAGVLALVSATRSPVALLGEQSGYHTRLLWATGAFIGFAVVICITRRLVQSQALLVAAVVTFTIATAVVAALNLPYVQSDWGTHEPRWTHAVVRDLTSQLGELEDVDTIFVDHQGDSFWYQFYEPAVLTDLEQRGISFVMDEGFILRSLGEHRRGTPESADAVLTIRTEDRAYEAPRGAVRVALHAGLTREQRNELSDLKDEIAHYISEGRVRLNERGKAALERLGALGGSGESSEPRGFDAEELLGRSRGLVSLIRGDLLVIDDTWAGRFARYRYLQERSDARSVGVYMRLTDNRERRSD
jgi:hypothetical protein